MTPLEAMFAGYAIVWGGLFAYVLYLHRLGRALQARLPGEEDRR